MYLLNIAQMLSECSREKLEQNIRGDKSTQDLAILAILSDECCTSCVV